MLADCPWFAFGLPKQLPICRLYNPLLRILPAVTTTTPNGSYKRSWIPRLNSLRSPAVLDGSICVRVYRPWFLHGAVCLALEHDTASSASGAVKARVW